MKMVRSILMCVLFNGIAFGASEELIRQQFSEYFTQNPLSESAVQRDLRAIREDGTWADIDYASQRRGEWPTRIHLDRLAKMATAWVNPSSAFYQQNAMKQAVLNGLDHWIKKDYRNPNWYNERIGVPYRLGRVLVLMGDAVSDKRLEDARPILYRSQLGMTGQNKVWCAGIGIIKGVLYADQGLLERAVADVWSELRVSTGEGIQPDWSFHQHGSQQQFGNYGLSFGEDMIQWASILRGTDYALGGKKLAILRSYLLEGPSWILWNGRMDFSGCGRQVGQGCQQSKARRVLRQLEGMKAVDPQFAAAYGSTEQRVGFKSFWRSEMGVQRRPDWYASVKMSSTRVIGSESCNSENMLGLHLGDGVLLTYVDGDEYEDLVPLWDWKRLPGTTCDQGFDALTPKTLNGYGGSSFSGVIGHGEVGMAAMIYQRGNLSARKSYFFFEDHMACLGSGISGETTGNVYTSVEQSWLKGNVEEGVNSVQHHGRVYQILDGELFVEYGEVQGTWSTSFPSRGERPASGKVFSAWINHGVSPKNASYAYTIFPTLGNEDSGLRSVVLENSTSVQAVEYDGAVYAVFYEAGTLILGDRRRVEVDGPCLLIMAGEKIIVADPTHSLQSLEIKINGKIYAVELPRGTTAGRQVEIK